MLYSRSLLVIYIVYSSEKTPEIFIKSPLLLSCAGCWRSKGEIYAKDEGLGIKELIFMLFFFLKKDFSL